MPTFEELGLHTNLADLGPETATADFPSSSQFFRQAEALLAAAAPLVRQEVVPNLADRAGNVHWNQGGFMVVTIGRHSLGDVRLHIWPAKEPRQNAYGPNVHEHGWLLCSLGVAGEYRDGLHELEEVAPANVSCQTENGMVPLRLFRSGRTADGGYESRFDHHVLPHLVRERRVPAGTVHHMSHSQYHLPVIPSGMTVATLALGSPTMIRSTGIVMPQRIDSGEDAIRSSRRFATKEELAGASSELMRAMEAV